MVNQDGIKHSVPAEAKKFSIDIYSGPLERLTASLHDVHIFEGIRTAALLDNMPSLLMHELGHFLLDGSTTASWKCLYFRLTRISSGRSET